MPCEHGKQKYFCRECGGGGICPHEHERRTCKKCGGTNICIHGAIKRFCIACGGSSICEHSRNRTKCINCKTETCKKHETASGSYMKLHCPFCKNERRTRSKNVGVAEHTSESDCVFSNTGSGPESELIQSSGEAGSWSGWGLNDTDFELGSKLPEFSGEADSLSGW
jgi:hypothetical protein